MNIAQSVLLIAVIITGMWVVKRAVGSNLLGPWPEHLLGKRWLSWLVYFLSVTLVVLIAVVVSNFIISLVTI